MSISEILNLCIYFFVVLLIVLLVKITNDHEKQYKACEAKRVTGWYNVKFADHWIKAHYDKTSGWTVNDVPFDGRKFSEIDENPIPNA